MLQILIDLIFNRSRWLWRRIDRRFDSVDRQLDEIRMHLEELNPNHQSNLQVAEMVKAEQARAARLDSLQSH